MQKAVCLLLAWALAWAMPAHAGESELPPAFSACAGHSRQAGAEEPLAEELRALEKSFGGRFGFMAKNLRTGEVIAWKAEDKFPTASLIKLPVMVEYFYQAAAGRLDPLQKVTLAPGEVRGGSGLLQLFAPGPEVRLIDAVLLMIVVSDNTASNLLLDRLGLPAINALLKHLGATRTALNRRFMQVPGPAGDNVTTASDCARILRALWEGRVVQGTWREEALETLRRQQYREKIPMMLPLGAVVGNKTGELDGVRHDIAVVENRGRAWVLAVLTRDGREPWEVDNRIARISRWCHDFILEGSLGP